MDYYYLAGLRDSRFDIDVAWLRVQGRGSASTCVAKGGRKGRDPTERKLEFGDGEHDLVDLRITRNGLGYEYTRNAG
jgi:hypothetical protein